MTTAVTRLEELIGKVKDLETLALRAAPQVAKVVEAHLRKTIAAGTDPYGVTWAPRKHDGARPLVNADQTLTVTAIGQHVITEIHGIDARHHHGWVKGKTKRPVIFTKPQLPPELIVEIRRVLEAEYQRTVEATP
jgi:uncharacterized protein (DUF2461 family)